MKRLTYLDNNATTMMTLDAQNALITWCNRGNPSSGYPAAKAARRMMDELRDEILAELGASKDTYSVVFTSGASEANCTAIEAMVNGYAADNGRTPYDEPASRRTPHIIMSSVEHRSCIEKAKQLVDCGRATISWVHPAPSGHILPSEIAAELALIGTSQNVPNNAALICVMHSNNETGAINNVGEINTLAGSARVPFFCDTVQSFCKVRMGGNGYLPDMMSISCHKFGGPPGIGALIIRKELVKLFTPLICGSQENSLRGGTENLPGMGSSLAALRIARKDRGAKTRKVLLMRQLLLDQLRQILPTRTYSEYTNISHTSMRNISPHMEIIILSSDGKSTNYLPGTMLFSVVKRANPPICNSKMKEQLYNAGYIVSIGSACNTSSASASHVLYAMECDEYIRRGTLRISFNEYNTEEDIIGFAAALKKIISML